MADIEAAARTDDGIVDLTLEDGLTVKANCQIVDLHVIKIYDNQGEHHGSAEIRISEADWASISSFLNN